jgi:hypothetical protein
MRTDDYHSLGCSFSSSTTVHLCHWVYPHSARVYCTCLSFLYGSALVIWNSQRLEEVIQISWQLRLMNQNIKQVTQGHLHPISSLGIFSCVWFRSHVRWVPLSPKHGASSGYRWKEWPPALDVRSQSRSIFPISTRNGLTFSFNRSSFLVFCPPLLHYRCNIWGFHSGDYEEWRLLRCYAVWLLYEATFRRNLSSPLSGRQESAS